VFAYPGQALHGVYDWVRYTAGEDCTIGPPPTEPPPPTGGATEVVVQQVAMSLDARATQAIAKVTVVDDLGRAVSGATVQGAWSGVIASGDGSRITDAAGAATFYSSRTRTVGEVKFCITGVQAAGLAYDGVSNLVTCGAIVK
jgi:hypothetical protein